MTDLQRYRRDIINDHHRLEMFCINLVEEIGDAEVAAKWLNEKFIPMFHYAIGDFMEREVADD